MVAIRSHRKSLVAKPLFLRVWLRRCNTKQEHIVLLSTRMSISAPYFGYPCGATLPVGQSAVNTRLFRNFVASLCKNAPAYSAPYFSARTRFTTSDEHHSVRAV